MVKRGRSEFANAGTVAKKSKGQYFKRSPLYRAIKSFMERKYWDTTNGYADFNSSYPTGTTVALSSIAEGSDFNNRLGRSISAQYVMIDVYCYMDSSATPSTSVPFTYHILIDRQPNGSLAGTTTILDQSVITNGVFSYKNTGSNDNRFTILKTVTSAVDLQAKGPYHERHYIRIPAVDSTIRYGGTTAAVPNTNNIIFAIAGLAASPSDAYWNMTSRLCFTDA